MKFLKGHNIQINIKFNDFERAKKMFTRLSFAGPAQQLAGRIAAQTDSQY